MRRLLFALSIALLLLRGWVGNAMAVEMALGHGLLNHAAVAMAASDPAQHTEMGMQHTMAADAEAHDCCGGQPSCSSCELCHFAAAWSLVPASLHTPGHGPFVALPSPSPASATPAPGLKPPIS